MAIKAFSTHLTQRTLVTEFQPDSGDFPALILLAGLLVLRPLAKLKARPLTTNPAFWLVCICWVLGFKARRFWGDWGWPGLMVLIACDLQLLLQTWLPANSLKRLALAGALAVAIYLGDTNDRDSRWTYNLTTEYLTQSDPEVAPWLPEKGGILYSGDMKAFYRTFFKNPNADWRYILGYEPIIMPPEDFNTYHSILWNFGDYKAYEPWVKKMRPQDRLVIYGSQGRHRIFLNWSGNTRLGAPGWDDCHAPTRLHRRQFLQRTLRHAEFFPVSFAACQQIHPPEGRTTSSPKVSNFPQSPP